MRNSGLLRVEAFLAFAVSLVSFQRAFPHHWAFFVLVFFVPDVTFILYAWRPSPMNNLAYNLARTYVLPAVLGIVALWSRRAGLGQISLVWICHVGFDRLLGLGLKYPNAPLVTHLQVVDYSSPSEISHRMAAAQLHGQGADK